MIDEEGSAVIDGEDFSENEGNENETEPETTNVGGQPQSNGQDDNSQPQDTGDQTPLTPKGTKLADDPMSAANQLLANERRRNREYEEFLSDPENVRRYLEELERETGGNVQSENMAKELTPESIETPKDLQDYLAQERAKDRAELENLKRSLGGFYNTQRIISTGQKIQSEISSVRQKYPQFDPNSPEFDNELEKTLADTFEELDFDPRSQTFQGKVSLSRLADKIMFAANKGAKRGSREAQTTVVDKRFGQVRSKNSGSNGDVDESRMTPEQIIASRIRRASSRR